MNFYIVTRQNRAPRPPVAVLATPTLEQVKELLPERKRGQLWACDLETKGTRAHSPEDYIVGIALADQDGCFYIDITAAPPDVVEYIKEYLGTCQLTAFNVMFDGAFLQVWTGRWLDWRLCSYAMFKNMTSEGFPGQSWSLDAAIKNVLGWPESNKDVLAVALKERGLSKADMWQLPADILGTYAAGDADAAWQLAEVLVEQATEEQVSYHQRIFMTEVRLWVEQQLRGLLADQKRLVDCQDEWHQRIEKAMPAFLNHPTVAPHIARYNEEVRAAWVAAEPPKLTKKGEVAARWQAWTTREQSWLEERGFNPNSKAQLCRLFYEWMGHKPLKKTPTGRPVVDRKVLPALGEPGKLLAAYNLLTKRRGYLNRVIERSAADGLIHVQLNSVGTVSTRPSGSGGLNALQFPKVPEFLWALRARPGCKLIQADAEAIEPTVLAQFSRDATLLRVYGVNALPFQDIYLLIACMIPAFAAEVRKYYDPDNPTESGLAAAKLHCSAIRDICKTAYLAYLYGAFPPKIHETLVLGGVDITLREVKQIHADLGRALAGVKKWQQRLLDIWATTGGWVPTLLGRPACVAERLLKDIVNRHTQTSAHEFLQVWIYHTDRLRRERGVEMYPWLVDYYDEQIWEAPEDQAEAAAKCIDDALIAANEELGMEIPIRGPSQIADNLAQIKCKNYDKFIKERAA